VTELHGPRARPQSEVGSEALEQSIDALGEFLDHALAADIAEIGYRG